jgi:hypothetical protein
MGLVMAAEIIQFVPKSRTRVKVLLPIVCRVPNAIEQVFVDALHDTSPCELNHDPEKEPA